jgi:alkyl hydroperoxide reductase subunit AhpC
MMNAMVGSPAPDFDLSCTTPPGSHLRRARLSDYRGGWLVVIFYPRDFSLVCPTELTALSERIEEFRSRDTEVVGISTDSVVSHERWLAQPRSEGGLGGLSFPLASDPDGSVSRAYGVYLESKHVALRGLYIIDPNGDLQYQVVHNLSIGRRSEEILRVLGALQTGGLCCERWSSEAPHTIDPTKVLRPGRVISHYRIEEEVGSGSFSTVYRARDLTLDRDVALKIFKTADPSRSKKALVEARAAASLSHQNVGTIFAVDAAEGAAMIAMEYLPGRTVSGWIAEGPQPAEWVGMIVRQVALGMAGAHANGLVHGDLKPANIMVSDDGFAKILDFGLSRRESPASHIKLDDTADAIDLEPSGLSGTPSYMAPEQAQGLTPSTASDVFALGVIVYEMLTGRKAFPGKTLLQVLGQIARVDPDRLADDLPAPFDDLIRRALVPDPDERTICMAEIAAVLAGSACPLEVVPA